MKSRRWWHVREKIRHVPPGSLALRLISTPKQGTSVGIDPACFSTIFVYDSSKIDVL